MAYRKVKVRGRKMYAANVVDLKQEVPYEGLTEAGDKYLGCYGVR